MKSFIITLVCIISFPVFSFCQNEPRYDYAILELTEYNGLGKSSLTIYYADGVMENYEMVAKDITLYNRIGANSKAVVNAFNYLDIKGYEYINSLVVSIGVPVVSNYIFRKNK